jgi:hypothetical protein
MNWIELLLAAAAVFLAAAAFRQSGKGASHQAEDAARDAALRQELALLREGIDRLPGRIADETAASPLREAVEAVRESINRLGDSFKAHTEASLTQSAASSSAVTESIKSSVSGLAAPLATLAELQGRQLEAASAQSRALDGLAGAVRASSEASASARTETRTAVLSGVERLTERTGALSEGLRAGAESTVGLKASLESILSAMDGLRGNWTESIVSLRTDLEVLPVRFAQAAAERPAPAPELEELAVAVRESGHLRGDVARQVAEAVARVGQELSESAAQARGDRDAAQGALESAMGRLGEVASQVRSALEPLEGALAGHGEAVAPMVQALQAAQDRLEEASSTQRANQVEFSASVDLFGHAAQELSTGLSAFAREGDKDGLEDPRQAQKALLEALERILKGFSDSLRALLSESDLRTRETLAELAARLPGGETPA